MESAGFAEALAVKCLAIVYPDRWIPIFVYPSENGKQAIMRLLPIKPLDEHGKSHAALAKESNDVLRELLEAVLRKRPLRTRGVPLVAPELFAMTRSPSALRSGRAAEGAPRRSSDAPEHANRLQQWPVRPPMMSHCPTSPAGERDGPFE